MSTVLCENLDIGSGFSWLSKQFPTRREGYCIELRLTPLSAFSATMTVRGGAQLRDTSAALGLQGLRLATTALAAASAAYDSRVLPEDVSSALLPSYTLRSTYDERCIHVVEQFSAVSQLIVVVTAGTLRLTALLADRVV